MIQQLEQDLWKFNLPLSPATSPIKGVTGDADISCLTTYSIIMNMYILNKLSCELKVWLWLLEKSAYELIQI